MSNGIKFHVITNASASRNYLIEPGQSVVIGRKEQANENSVVVNAQIVSGRHAILFLDSSGQLYIQDSGSTNGTFVNGKRLEPTKNYNVSEQDKITLSSSQNIEVIILGSAGGRQSAQNSIMQSRSINELLKNKKSITIGRSESCDITIDHRTVSREHAVIEKRPHGSLVVIDKNSVNGTFVNSYRIKGPAKLNQGDRLNIGWFEVPLEGIISSPVDESTIAISAKSIEMKYPNGFVGLKRVSFNLSASSLVAVMGPSGCGKSTLLKGLCGDTKFSSGSVELFGLELESNYQYLRSLIGYVPQDDIVHRDLTVMQSLYYAAKLRIPNASEAQMQNKINEILRELKIETLKDSLVSNISGGQRKRVSIAVELLPDPLVLFLDEPTSPLDPQTIEEFMQILKDLASNDTSIVMVTHKPEDLEFMGGVIFMTSNGHVVYNGTVDNALSYFGVDKIRDIYKELDIHPKVWTKKWEANQTGKGKNPVTKQPPSRSAKIDFLNQFTWLSKRYFSVKINDKANTGLMILQAPIIAMLVCLIFKNIAMAVPFLMAVSAVWFGANNAAREIVCEMAIFKRERMFNQGVFPYIFSKLVVLGAFAAIQSFLFIGIITLFYQQTAGSEEVVWNNPGLSFIWMLCLSLASSMMGLFLSALVTTTERVMTIVPIVLIPQIMLAGIVARIDTFFVELVSYLTLSRWGTEGFSILQKEVMIEKMEIKDGTGVPSVDNPGEIVPIELVRSEQDSTASAVEAIQGQFHESYDDFGAFKGTMDLDFMAVGLLTLFFFFGIYWALKKKDSIKITAW